jgi:hypothetical protein
MNMLDNQLKAIKSGNPDRATAAAVPAAEPQAFDLMPDNVPPPAQLA